MAGDRRSDREPGTDRLGTPSGCPPRLVVQGGTCCLPSFYSWGGPVRGGKSPRLEPLGPGEHGRDHRAEEGSLGCGSWGVGACGKGWQASGSALWPLIWRTWAQVTGA